MCHQQIVSHWISIRLVSHLYKQEKEEDPRLFLVEHLPKQVSMKKFDHLRLPFGVKPIYNFQEVCEVLLRYE